MAGGAYKGLTIRIGADTTKLSSALRGIDSAAFKTQRELTKLNKAAQLDPKNSKLASAQLGTMAAQATATATKMTLLSKSVSEVGAQKSKSDPTKTIGELAKSTDNVALKAAEATQRYNELNAAIEPAYDEVEKITGFDLREATNDGNFDAVFNLIKESGEVSQETISKIESMKDAWISAFNEMEDFKLAESMHNAQTDMQVAEAQIRQMAKAMAELNTKSAFSKQFKGDASQLGLLSAAADTVENRMSRLNESMRLDPTSIDTASERARTLADAIGIAEKQGEILNGQLMKYQDAGIEASASKLREQYGSIAEALSRTKEAYEDTAPAVAKYEARLNHAQDVLQHMQDADDGSEEAKAGIERQRASVAELTKEYEKAKAAHSSAEAAYDTAKACSEMDNLKVRVIENTDHIMKLRDAFGGIEIRSGVSLQVGTLADQMKVISTGAETAKTRFDTLNNAMQVKPHSLGIAIDRVRAFREATDAAQQKAQNLRQQIDQYKSEGIDRIANRTKDAAIAFEKAQDEVNDLTKQLAEAEAKFGKNSDEAHKLGEALKTAMTNANTAAAVNEYKNLETQLRDTEAEAKQLADSMKVSFGDIGSAAVIAGQQVGQLAQSAWSSISESSTEVDSAYRDLRKTLDTSEDDYKTLYDAAMQYGQANVTSASTMLEMESIAAQLGVGLNKDGEAYERTAEQIQKFAEVAANLDVATNIDAESIALQMGQIQNVMSDLNPDNIDSFGDALVRLGNTMPTQESNIMQITQRLSSIGDVAGFTTPQLMGWAAAIASTGQKSEAAASGISTTITNIAKAVSAGNKGLDDYAKKAGVSVETLSKAISDNSKDLKTYASAAGVSTQKLKEAAEGAGKLEKFAEVAHMSADEFSKAWKEKPSEALEAFISGLKDTDDELFATLMDLDINGVRQNQTLASLANTVDTVGSAIGRAEDAWNGGGDAADEATKKAQGFSGTMEKVKNSVQVLGATFGDRMVPYLNIALDVIQRFTGWLENLDDKTVDAGIKVGGLAVAFATVWPVVSTLGGALKQFASGALGLVVQGIANLVGGGAIGSVGDLFAALSLGAETAATGIATFVATANPVPAILGALAAALVAVGVKEMYDAKKSAEEYQGALADISGVTEDLGTKMWVGSDAIDKYAEKWSAARVNMSEYHKELKKHTDAQNEAIDSMSATVGELEHYRDIIDDAIGKGKDFHGNLGELQWAIDKLNEKTGASWTLQEILTGKYEDEEGAIKSTKDALDELIGSKEREAKINGIEAALSENYAAQEKNKIARQSGASAYQNAIDLELDIKHKTNLKPEMSDTEYIKYLKETDEHIQGLWLDNKKLREESRLLKDQEDELSNTLGGLIDVSTYATSTNYGERESIMQLSDGMKDALQSFLGFTDSDLDAGIKGIAQSLMEAGVSTEQFADIGAKKFAELAEQSGGDVQRFVELLAEVSGQDATSIDVKANIDKAQEMLDQLKEEANGTEAEVGVNADTSSAEGSIDEVKDKADNTTGTESIEADNSKANDSIDETKDKADNTTGTVTIEAKQSEENADVTEGLGGTTAEVNIPVKVDTSKIDKLRGKIEKLPKNTPVKVSYNDGGAVKKVENLRDKLKKTSKTWPATFSLTVNDGGLGGLLRTLHDENGKRYSSTFTVYKSTVKGKGDGPNATGGYMPANRIPRHADGFIATRATLTDYGWIGEAGAEAYSGGSLVPLTNRKYSQPYINDISDAVARKLGPINGGNQISVTVTGVASPDEVANAIARKLSILDL